VLLVALAMFGVFFFVSLYMQNILGYSAVQAGAAFLPMTVLIILIAPIAGKATDRIGSRSLLTVGMVLVGIQLVYFSQLGPDAVFWNLLPGLLVGGVGIALVMPPGTAGASRLLEIATNVVRNRRRSERRRGGALPPPGADARARLRVGEPGAARRRTPRCRSGHRIAHQLIAGQLLGMAR
jgi:MFS family permease